jgi:hypothetical protein
MPRTVCTCLVLFLGISTSAHAQFAVIDPANLAQAVLIAERTWQQYDQLRQQFETIQKMAQGIGDMDRFRTPALALAEHDPAKWQYGGAWLAGLNSGDPSGAAYRTTVLPLRSPRDAPVVLSPDAWRSFERQYSTVEITDSAAETAGHQVGLVRSYYERLQRSIDALESDVVNRRSEYHEMTAVLDKIAAGEMIARRQDTAINQLLSDALEQLLARGKSIRDTEATTINMQIGTWRDGRPANDAFVAGTGDALRTWRQP